MLNVDTATAFAPAERFEKKSVDAQHYRLDHLPMIHQLVDIVPEAFLILNKRRQIVFCNATFAKMLGIKDDAEVRGLRPGEALECMHSNESEGGCGTTEYCVYCGAVNAIMDSQNDHSGFKTEECRIIGRDGTTALTFRVWTKNLTIGDEDYTIFIARDVSDEKRKAVLEKIFFHDIMNTAGGINGVIKLLKTADKDELEELVDLIHGASNTLIEEINAQREILAAESGELEPDSSRLNSIGILKSVYEVYAKHEVAAGKRIEISQDSDDVDFNSDARILTRIIGNMVKNALEAESPGATISIDAKTNGAVLEFNIHNPKVMPDEAKRQVFQRSYSTKGKGRGLGTYSIKLLGEKFLKGKASFTSEHGLGTIFTFSLPYEGGKG